MGTILDSAEDIWSWKEDPSRKTYQNKKKLEKNKNQGLKMILPIFGEEKFVEEKRKRLEELLYGFNHAAQKTKISREAFGELLRKNNVPKELQQSLVRAIYGHSKYVGLDKEVPMGRGMKAIDEYFETKRCLSSTETIAYFCLGWLVRLGAGIYNTLSALLSSRKNA